MPEEYLHPNNIGKEDMTSTRIAVLDDYMQIAGELADWTSLPGQTETDFFYEKLPEGTNERAKILADYDVLVVTRERTPLPKELMERLPKLKFIASPEMHNRVIDFDYCRSRGIPVCGTTPRPSPTFELTWALILALAKNVTIDDRAMRDGKWQTVVGTEIRGKTLGVIGLGRIGSEVAKVGNAFGMEVIAWSENMTFERAEECGATLVSKDDLFRRSDYVVVMLIQSDRTIGLVGAHEIGLMRPNAYLINPARGPIVDETALVEALKNKNIAGAGIDVYDVEPLPEDHPLRGMPNTVLMPHVAGFTREHYAHWYNGMLEDVRAWLDGRIINEIHGSGVVAVRV
ncbi:MAG: D-3-phosphoglycerate dehydrogenase [Alphaproteobacteria bacterium MarineAlpha4_Bin2]|nr:MAG: D-3-phosphoglycerate dehydrogenase [Alphaproteobacteria bacterium MarineAlpha4_Bin2]